jgi:RND family efflux transporter MFP subunit
MNVSPQWIHLVPLLAGVLLAGCTPPPAATPVVPAVFVTAVRNDTGAMERVLSGTVRPRVEADLSFRAGGKVVQRRVDPGQAVRSGEVLAQLDVADFALGVQAAADQVRAAEVDATQAASDAARFRRLLAEGSVGAADVERQQARADAAAARLAQARRQAELAGNRAGYATLTAPFDGVVTAVRFEAGQTVAEGQPVLTLARPGELEVQVDVPEDLVGSLRKWQATARLRGDDLTRGDALPLRLREVAASAAPVTRTYRVRYALGPMPVASALRLGMTAEVVLRQPGSTPSAEVPLSALLVTPSPAASGAAAGGTPAFAAAVWRVDPGTGALQRQPVGWVSQTTDHVRVTGLPDGALVVSVGAQKLDAGLKVRPVPRPLDGALSAAGSR